MATRLSCQEHPMVSENAAIIPMNIMYFMYFFMIDLSSSSQTHQIVDFENSVPIRFVIPGSIRNPVFSCLSLIPAFAGMTL
jgi:hypothetical protein